MLPPGLWWGAERLFFFWPGRYDIEQGSLTAFAGLWAMPEYERYVEGNFGPAGEYLMSCRKCHFDKAFLSLTCQCRGLPETEEGKPYHEGRFGTTKIQRPHDCVKAGYEASLLLPRTRSLMCSDWFCVV